VGDIKQEIRDLFYAHVHLQHHGDNEPRWRGVHTIKFPTDLILYQEAIYQNKPDYIIKTGTRFGGSAIFFADMLKLFNPSGKVITVDITSGNFPQDPMIKYITGSSTDIAIIQQISQEVSGKKVMVVLDSDHRSNHVKREMHHYGRMVTKGQFMVVEDCYMRNEAKKGPGVALDWYLTKTNKFNLEHPEDKYFVAVTRGGWLRRIK
jgi:cephalosporin hydroxylase